MNSGTKISQVLIIASGAMLLFLGTRYNAPIEEVSIAPSEYNIPKPIDIKPKEKKQWYKYRVEIETIPEKKLYKIEKSGYNQYEISRRGSGENYSYKTYEFISDKVMNTQEAYNYVINNLDKCTLVSNISEENIYDRYNDDYEGYIDDTEDEINYPPEIFDFLAD